MTVNDSDDIYYWIDEYTIDLFQRKFEGWQSVAVDWDDNILRELSRLGIYEGTI